MPNYKDLNGSIHFLESSEFAHLLPSGCVSITDAEAAKLSKPTAEAEWGSYQGQAKLALDVTDNVALRCWKAGVAFPDNWKTYVDALRTIVRATGGDPTKPLPTRPTYPAGT